MRLSTVFELLLIFLFLALASSRHIDKKRLKKGVTKQSNLNPYCTCSELQCNCCRDFPVVPIKGPGCASLGYKSGESLQLTMSFGDRVLRNITLVGKRPKPVCMGLPGGISKFCGRLYNIERLNDQFKACLSLELRALDDLEAALRVSCFNFGPKGVKLEPGAPLPSAAKPADEDDDDDDYDLEDDDDDDDDGDEFDDDDDEYNDVDTDGDYTGFAALSDQLFEGFFFPTAESSSGNKKKKPVRPVSQESIDVVPEVTTKSEASVDIENKEVTTTLAPETSQTSTNVPSTTLRLVETKGPSTVITSTAISTTAPPKNVVSEKTESTEQSTDSPSTEADITTEAEDEKDNETEDSESTEDVSEQKEVEEEDNSEGADRDEEDSNEGSAEEELEEDDKTKQEDEEGDEDEEEDSEEEDEHESAEQEESQETKNDNILNVFFEDSNETEREKARMEREKLQKILPGLMELLKPSPTPPSEAAFAYPAVRSARVHRRMRLPPI